MRKALGLLAAFSLAGCLSGLPPDSNPSPDLAGSQLPDDGCDGCIVLLDAQIFDGDKAFAGAVVMKDDRIVKVLAGPNAGAGIKTGTIVSLDGKTILPGLIDLHAHTPAQAGPYGYYSATDIVDDHWKPMLRAGVTTVLDLGSSKSIIFEYRDRIRAGKYLAPNLFASGPMLTTTGGHPCYKGTPASDACVIVDGPGEVMDDLAALLPAKPDVVKIILESGPLGDPLPRMTDASIQAVAQSAQAAGFQVIAHVGKAGDVDDGLAAGVTAFAHIPSEDLMTADECKALVDHNAVVVPTLVVNDSIYQVSQGTLIDSYDASLSDEIPDDLIQSFSDPAYVGPMQTPYYKTFAQGLRDNSVANFKTCLAAGVHFVAGTDAGNPGTFFGLSLRRELALYVANGMSAHDALVTATSAAADFLGRGDLGRIAEGAVADLLIVDGDPLTDIGTLGKVSQVYHNGKAIDRESLKIGAHVSMVLQATTDVPEKGICLSANECASGLYCGYGDVCVPACIVGNDASCGKGNVCFSASTDGTSKDGYCFQGDGCDVLKQDCSNGAACIWLGNGATYCNYAGVAMTGPCTNGCAVGYECDFSNQCGKICDPKGMNQCPNNLMCWDQTGSAGLSVGECH